MCEARSFWGRGSRFISGKVALVVFGIAPSSADAEPHDLADADLSAGLGNWSAFDALQTLGAGFLLVYIAIVLARGRKRPQSADGAHEKQVSDAVAAIRPVLERRNRLTLAPRTLPHSPFMAVRAPLEDQIEIAAEACLRLSRTIGLVYFEIPAYAEIERREGKDRADAIVSALADAMRHHLRVTDHVVVREGHQIIVCVCLLDNASDLEGVAKRLAIIVQRHRLGGDGDALARPGLAVYPLHGCAGSDLIDAARRSYHAAREAGGGSERWIEPAEFEALGASLRPETETKPALGGRVKSKLSVVARPEDEKEPPA